MAAKKKNTGFVWSHTQAAGLLPGATVKWYLVLGREEFAHVCTVVDGVGELGDKTQVVGLRRPDGRIERSAALFACDPSTLVPAPVAAPATAP